MRLTLWGTRGSHASPGHETVRYGGHTSCVEVRGAGGEVLVLDAGTGMQPLGATLVEDRGRVDILLTHLHMDHVQGLGFFRPLFHPGREVHIWGPSSTTLDLRGRLSRYLSPPLFPVLLRDLPCKLDIHDVNTSRFSVGGLEVECDLVCHPGPTVGYRVSEGGAAAAYLPDHEPALGTRKFPDTPDWTSGHDLAKGVDLLIHDAQYTPEEYEARVGWGHSTFQQTLALARLAGAKRLVTFHHDPMHSDDFLDGVHEILRGEAGPALEVIGGRQGMSFDVG